MRDLRVVDWGGSPGDKSALLFISSLNAYLALEYVSAGSGFKVGLYYDATYYMGNDAFAWSPTTHHARISTDGSRIMLEFGSTLSEQVNRSEVDKVASGYVALTGTITDADLIYCKEIAICSGDSGSDRPDPSSLDIVKMVPITGSPHHDEFANPASNKYAEVDDWDSGDSDGDTTSCYNPGAVGTTYRQTFLTANQTLSNIRGLMLYRHVKATAAAKDLWEGPISSDGSNADEPGVSLLGPNYVSRRALFQLAPDGGAWTQTDLDNFEIGVKWQVGDDAVTVRLTAAQAEAVGFDLDAGEIPARDWPENRRRILAQVA
jgi:hypothetical protein